MKKIKEFVSEIQGAERLSKNTVNGYVQDINHFTNWLKDTESKAFEKATEQDVKAYMGYLSTECKGRGGKVGLAPTSVNRKLASLVKAYTFLVDCGDIKNNPTQKVKRQKTDKNKKPSFMTEDEVDTLLQTVKTDSRKGIKKEAVERDYAIIRLMVATGMRVSEVCDMEQKDIDFKKLVITVVGKGNKTRYIPISQSMVSILQAWLHVRDKFKPNTNKVFVSKFGSALNRDTVNKMLKTYCNMAGLDSDVIHAHTLRHTCGTLTYKANGGDLRGVQEQLGHSSIATTQIYTHLADEAIRKSAMANPFA